MSSDASYSSYDEVRDLKRALRHSNIREVAYKSKICKQSREISELEDEVDDQKKKNSGLKRSLQSSVEKVERLEDRNTRLASERNQLQREVHYYRLDNDRLRRELRWLKEEARLLAEKLKKYAWVKKEAAKLTVVRPVMGRNGKPLRGFFVAP